MVELLGQYGADVNVRGNSGSTAYDIASMIGMTVIQPSEWLNYGSNVRTLHL